MRLLLFVTILSVWIGINVRRANLQRDAVASLQAVGAGVVYYHQYPERKLNARVNRDAPAPGPAWLRQLVGDDFFARVRMVHFATAASVSDDDLAHLRHLPELEWVSLWDKDVSDAGLKHLRNLRGLRRLSIHGGEITNDGLKHIGDLDRLEELSLTRTGTRITGSGLEHLQRLTELRSLHLEGWVKEDVDISALSHLTRLEELCIVDWAIGKRDMLHLSTTLRRLKRVELRGTKITKNGVLQLKQALPGCRFLVRSR